MTPTVQQGPLEMAEIVLRVDLMPPTVRARVAAVLARQALEESLRERYGTDEGSRIPLRSLLAHARAQEPEFGREAGLLWLQLTWACHQRPEEQDPDVRVVTTLVEDVVKLVR